MKILCYEVTDSIVFDPILFIKTNNWKVAMATPDEDSNCYERQNKKNYGNSVLHSLFLLCIIRCTRLEKVWELNHTVFKSSRYKRRVSSKGKRSSAHAEEIFNYTIDDLRWGAETMASTAALRINPSCRAGNKAIKSLPWSGLSSLEALPEMRLSKTPR